MADIDFTVAGGAIKRLRDMGDGTWAEVVALAADPSIDIGDVQLLAGTALIGKVGIDQTTAGTTNGMVLNSSPILGEVQASPTANTVLDRLKTLHTDLAALLASKSSCFASATFDPLAAAYGAGDIFDVAKEFAFTYADGSAVPPGSGLRIFSTIVKIDETGLQASEGAYSLQPYTVTPPSAQADNATWTLASADLSSYTGEAIPLGTPVDLGAALAVKRSNIDVDIKLTTSSLWGRLVTGPAFTPTAVARQVFIIAMVT